MIFIFIWIIFQRLLIWKSHRTYSVDNLLPVYTDMLVSASYLKPLLFWKAVSGRSLRKGENEPVTKDTEWILSGKKKWNILFYFQLKGVLCSLNSFLTSSRPYKECPVRWKGAWPLSSVTPPHECSFITIKVNREETSRRFPRAGAASGAYNHVELFIPPANKRPDSWEASWFFLL